TSLPSCSAALCSNSKFAPLSLIVPFHFRVPSFSTALGLALENCSVLLHPFSGILMSLIIGVQPLPSVTVSRRPPSSNALPACAPAHSNKTPARSTVNTHI